MSVKKEYRIDSSDSARPAATLDSQPHYVLTNMPEPARRQIADIVYDETDEVINTRTGDQVQVVIRTIIYTNGDTDVCGIGAKHPAYLEYKRTGVAVPEKSTAKNQTDREHSPAVKAALAKLKKTAKKED